MIDLGLGQQGEQTGQDARAHRLKGEHLEHGLVEIVHRLKGKAPHVKHVDAGQDLDRAGDHVQHLFAREPFLDALCGGREFQKEAMRVTIRYLLGGKYNNLKELAEENYHQNPIRSFRTCVWNGTQHPRLDLRPRLL